MDGTPLGWLGAAQGVGAGYSGCSIIMISRAETPPENEQRSQIVSSLITVS